MFKITESAIDIQSLRALAIDQYAGGFTAFEGWVRNHHEGKAVESLEYTAYTILAEKEGRRIIEEAKEKFQIVEAVCHHRIGHLAIGDMAVYVAVSAAHRDAAFAACRYIIDETKSRVPIWKKEYYVDGTTEFPHCQGCGHSH